MTLALAHMARLVRAELGIEADVRELVVQRQSYEASHTATTRARPEDLIALYAIDETISQPAPQQILIVDDVLTTGSHFVAMRQVLEARFPGVWIGGLFVARRKLADDADDFDTDGD